MVKTDKDIAKLETRDKRYRVPVDGADKLYVEVMKSGRKTFQTRIGQSFRKLGAAPPMTIKIARTAALMKQAEAPASGSVTLRQAWTSYRQKFVDDMEPATRKNNIGRAERYLLPKFGARDINAITGPELLKWLQEIENDGKREIPRRLLMLYGQVARHAVARGEAERDVSQDIRGQLKPKKHNRHPAITDPRELGPLLRAIDTHTGHPPIVLGLKLQPLLALRPSEQRLGVWAEVDFDEALWRIPAARMKMSHDHIVPLSSQAITLLRELRQYHDGPLMFPGIRTQARPISDASLNSALRQLGYSADRIVCHGFRTTFSTLLNEQGVNPDWIETQLAHTKGGVRGIYNAAEYLQQRREMMQQWADYLDTLRDS